ncbi:MAG: hypothetical protein ACXAC7_23995, partial [Candidatus Hodarchaeales archaeon]
MRKNYIKKKIVLSLSIFFIFSMITPIASSNYKISTLEKSEINIQNRGDTLYVGGSGPDNYSSIQGAVNAAQDGDTIFVYSGVYFENVLIPKTVTLIGEDKETTIIDG